MTHKSPDIPVKFLIELETTSACSDPIKSLRALLKLSKRRLGLRCTAAEAIEARQQGKPK